MSPNSNVFRPPSGVSWSHFRDERPEMAVAGQELLYQFGVGLAFLGTVRADGGPRLHPICPLLTDESMYAFIISSPKLNDLARDGRYALHSYPRENDEDAFYVTGTSSEVVNQELRNALERQFFEERPTIELPDGSLDEQTLIEFFIDTCLVTRTVGHGDPNPRHEIWHSGETLTQS